MVALDRAIRSLVVTPYKGIFEAERAGREMSCIGAYEASMRRKNAEQDSYVSG